MLKKTVGNFSYCFQDHIGKGSSSEVYKGNNNITNEPVAIKVIDHSKLKSQFHHQLLQSEIQALNSLNSDNVIKLYQVIQTANNTYLITELCDSSDLLKQGKLSESKVQKIMQGVIQGYYQLKLSGIVHRDIKPANIFLQNNIPKIADFGFAVTPQTAQTMPRVNVGSPLYMSPEALMYTKYSEKSDIWAIGITAYELLHEQVPWSAYSEKELAQKMCNQPAQINNVSSQCQEFIRMCLSVEEQDRPSVEDLMKCEWIQPKPVVLREVHNKVNLNSPMNMNKQNEKILVGQLNFCRFLSKLLGKVEQQMEAGLLRDKLEFFLIKNIMIKMNKLKQISNTNNYSLKLYDDYKQSVEFKKILGVVEYSDQKFSKQFDDLWQRLEQRKEQLEEDKKFAAVFDQMFTEFHSFYIILQSYLQDSLKELKEVTTDLCEDLRNYVRLTSTILDKSSIEFANQMESIYN